MMTMSDAGALRWDAIMQRAETEPVRYASTPNFHADGRVSSEIPLEQDAVQEIAHAFDDAGWAVTPQGSGLLTTTVQAGPFTVPLFIGSVSTPSLLRTWVSTPLLLADADVVETLDVPRLYSVVLEALQMTREGDSPPVAQQGQETTWPFLLISVLAKIPVLGSGPVVLADVPSGKAVLTGGLNLTVPHERFRPEDIPWMAHNVAHAMRAIAELAGSDIAAWSENMPGLSLPTADAMNERGLATTSLEPDEPPTAFFDEQMLLGEATRHADAGDKELAERFWTELIRMQCPSSGSATNSLVFQVLNPGGRFAEAQAYLMRSVLKGYEFEAQNSVSNLAVTMTRRGHRFAAVPLQAWLAVLNDERLIDETTYHLAQFAADHEYYDIARAWLQEYEPSGLGSYDEAMTELLGECDSAIAEGRGRATSQIFSDLLRALDATTAREDACERLVRAMAGTVGLTPIAVADDPYRAQARRAQQARQPLIEMAWLGLSVETAPSPSATDAAERLLEVFADETDPKLWAVVALAVTQIPGEREGRILAALTRSALQLECIAEAAALSLHAAGRLIRDGDATVSDAIAVVTARAEGYAAENPAEAERALALLAELRDPRADQARARSTRDQDLLATLLQAEDEEVAMAALANRHLSPEVVESLAVNADADLAWSMAATEDCPPQVLAVLAGHPAESVRRAVAGHANTPESDLDRLSADDAWTVREAVRLNAAATETARATAALMNGT